MNLDDKEEGAGAQGRATHAYRCAMPRSLRRGERRSFIAPCRTSPRGGACLKLANTYGVPEIFELTFELGRTRRPCRVIWRTNDELGVAFEGSETAAAGN